MKISFVDLQLKIKALFCQKQLNRCAVQHVDRVFLNIKHYRYISVLVDY